MTEGRAGARLKALAGIVGFMFLALITRLWFLQVLAAERYRDQAADNYVRLVDVPAPRGRILDARGAVLVANRTSIQVTVNRQEAGEAKEEVLFELSKVLGVPADVLGERLDDPRFYAFTPIPIAIDVPKRVAFYIKENQDDFPGVDIVKAPVRTYPQGNLAAHVLGYLGQISQDKLDDAAFADYEPGDTVGVTGVEDVYEHDLRGTEGFIKYRLNSTGENLGVLGTRDPAPGDDVVLTIDLRIQKLAEESLVLGMEHARAIFDESSGTELKANAGAVIVLDPETGGIEAMASLPTYQPKAFTRSLSNEEYEQRFGAATGYPLLNRAIQGEYPPGSTYKPWIALSALSRGFASTQQSYPCTATWQVPEDPLHHVFHNWSPSDLGYMNLAQALVHSCDTIFYPIGYQYWPVFFPPPWDDGVAGNDGEPAKEPLQHDLRGIGFDRVTNIDLPGEQEGRVPDGVWKREIHKQSPKLFPDGRWFPGDFVNMSIGQGDTLVTPIQLATAYAALQNDGHACAPHVLSQVATPDGKVVRAYRPRCGRRLPFTQAQVEYVRNALTQVPLFGTAAFAFRGFPFDQVWLAGKTGTAEVIGKQDFSWFAALTRAGGEQHVVVALVEQGGHGSTTAAPIARRIVEGIYGLPATQFLTVGGTD